MIERAKNTNVVVLSEIPVSITGVTVKTPGSKFFTNINNYTLVEKTVTLKKTYTEIKVDFVSEKENQYVPHVDKGEFNFRLSNISKTNPMDLITATSKTAQTKRMAVQGSKGTDIGQLLGGFLTLSKNTKQNQSVTDEPVMSIVTDGVPNITVKKTSDEKGNISILTNTTTEDGLLNTMIVTANPAGIKAALKGVLGASDSQTKEALKETSTAPDKVEKAVNENISVTITKDAKTVVKKANRTLDNPPGSDLPFGSLGNSFGNVLGAVLGKIKGAGSISKVGEVLEGIPPGFVVPEGATPPVNIIEEDGTTNIAKSTKPTNNASETVRSSRDPYVVASAVSGWKGVATPISTGEYVFETVHTSEELEAELRNTTRKITTTIVHWSKTHSNSPLTARDIHVMHMAAQTEALGGDGEALRKLVDLGPKGGIDWHYVIKRDGTIERGRPLDIESGDSVGFTSNTLHIGFVAGYSAPFGTPNSELTLGSASITPEQWKSFDQFLEAFYKSYPGGEVLGYREINPSSSGPGFDVSVYASGKYNKTSIYDDASTLHQPYTPEEQINTKPKTVKQPSASTIELPPDPVELSVADVDTTKTQAELDANAAKYSKLNRSVLSTQRDIDGIKKDIDLAVLDPNSSPFESLGKVATKALDLADQRLELNQMRKDFMNEGYVYDQKNETWSKP